MRIREFKIVTHQVSLMYLLTHFPLFHPCYIIYSPVTNRVPYVDSVNSLNYFSVPWEKDNLTLTENYPTLNNTCGNGVCTITNDNNCMCSLSLSETPAFNSLPSRESVLSLKVGAYDPATFSDSAVTYQLKESSANVEAFVLSDTGIIGDTSTIFKVVDEFGETVFFKNLVSIVTLGNTYSLRNPPSFMSLLKVDLRDAEYEGNLSHSFLLDHASLYIYIDFSFYNL